MLGKISQSNASKIIQSDLRFEVRGKFSQPDLMPIKNFIIADIALLPTATITIAEGMKTRLILASLVYLVSNAPHALPMPDNGFCLSGTCKHAMANSPFLVARLKRLSFLRSTHECSSCASRSR